MSTQQTGDFRSGFVALAGRPNVGKSTLLNRILGEKLAIVSDKPQTTRNRIQGIHSQADAQVIFVDTPGVHQARSRLNRSLQETALAAVKGVDVVLFLVVAGHPPVEAELGLLADLGRQGAPVFLVVNKLDRTAPDKLAACLAEWQSRFPFRQTLGVSALTGAGVDELLAAVVAALPPGPRYFPDDQLTDLPERFIAAEIVREQVFRLTRDEIPYATAVTVESFKERPDGLVAISATITVERDSQKGIVIGRRGEMLRRIGSAARLQLEEFLQTRVFLELFVRVRKDWSDNESMLKEFGYP